MEKIVNSFTGEVQYTKCSCGAIANFDMEHNHEAKCAQCHQEMDTYGNENFTAPFCRNPECPNYGLLQAGIL